MITFFYDADSEMSLEKAQEFGITENFIKMPYSICGENRYCDFLTPEISKEFFEKIAAGNMPSTSALNSEEYKEIFEPHFAKGEEIFYVSFSSNMSATFNHLDVAIKELSAKYPDASFTRYDSKGISMAAGLVVLAAAKCIKAGKSVAETVEFLDTLTPNVNAFLIADDLQYLKRGGRLTAMSALLGGILQIKPIIKLTDIGTLIPTEKVQGQNKALATITNEVVAGAKYLDEYPIIIMNAACPDTAARAADRIKAHLPQANIWQMNVGPVIGTHCGPGTVAVCFVGGKRPEAPKKD